MKILFILSFFFLSFMESTVSHVSNSHDPNVLLGSWKLDMTPQDKTDDNFASMQISKVENNSFQGYFYRKGVKIREAQINTKTDVLYGALISGDNSGTYNTTFYYKDGILYGTTHSIDKDFLAVWTATKNN